MGGNTTHYVYGLNGLLYGEYNNSGNLIREYIYLNDQPLAQIDAGSPETVTYLHVDHLGTPRFGTDSGGSQVWAWAGDAFGVGAPTGTATVNLRMPGQYYDDESGLFYNWNRYYNPAIGRYISSDPIGLGGGINTFLYAKANPVLYSDPWGLAYDWEDLNTPNIDAINPDYTIDMLAIGGAAARGSVATIRGAIGLVKGMAAKKGAAAPAAGKGGEFCPIPNNSANLARQLTSKEQMGRRYQGRVSRY